MGGFFINQYSILFHPELDRLNGYKTIIWNVGDDRVLMINRSGYELLKIINERPGLSREEISQLVGLRSNSAEEQNATAFLNQMLAENIIFEK